MIILRDKYFNEIADKDPRIDELYGRYIKANSKKARKERTSPALNGMWIGATAGGIGGAIIPKKSKIPLGIAVGALGGSALGYGSKALLQHNEYKKNKEDLNNILKGFKTESEKQRFLGILEDELNELK